MPLPVLDEATQKMPLCYDPARHKYIYYKQIISGKQKIIPVDSLSDEDLRKLVIKRLRNSPKFIGGPMSSPYYSAASTIEAIESSTKFGLQTLEAEKSMLRDLLSEIEKNL